MTKYTILNQAVKQKLDACDGDECFLIGCEDGGETIIVNVIVPKTKDFTQRAYHSVV